MLCELYCIRGQFVKSAASSASPGYVSVNNKLDVRTCAIFSHYGKEAAKIGAASRARLPQLPSDSSLGHRFMASGHVLTGFSKLGKQSSLLSPLNVVKVKVPYSLRYIGIFQGESLC